LPPKTAWLLYDGDCSLCEKGARALARFDLDGRLSLVDLRTQDLSFLPAAISRDQAAARLHLVEPGGRVSEGFYAVRRLTAVLPALWPAAPLFHFPGARLILEPAYDLLARLRFRLSSPR
jgi:predicted DCC family thiol-disulfide oxidoreductase YuxK